MCLGYKLSLNLVTINPNSQKDELGDWRILKPYKPFGNGSSGSIY